MEHFPSWESAGPPKASSAGGSTIEAATKGSHDLASKGSEGDIGHQSTDQSSRKPEAGQEQQKKSKVPKPRQKKPAS